MAASSVPAAGNSIEFSETAELPPKLASMLKCMKNLEFIEQTKSSDPQVQKQNIFKLTCAK